MYADKPPLDELMHYGMPRRSGRYPYGSGDDPYQHSGDFLSRIDELKKKGLSEKEIADSFKLTTSQFRTQRSMAKEERRSLDVATAKRLRDKEGLSLNEIADRMGFKNDSSVRSLLNENAEARMNQSKSTANFLKEQVDKRGMIDVGSGVERELGVSKEKLNQALYMLEMEGYPTYGGGVPQVTNPGKQTNLKVLCPPGTEHKEIYNFDKVNSLREYESHDQGETFDKKFVYPKSIDSKRVAVRYKEDGGIERDGTIEIRRNVDDLNLGGSRYAQVRILVDGTHYLKGMAHYSDDLPDGVDIMFNTNKSKDVAKMDVFKKIKDNPDNPFGALLKQGINDPDGPPVKGGQSYYYDKDGKKQLSAINKTREEGDWGEWAKKLPSQMLSKQNITMVKKQLGLAMADKQAEYDEICALENPTVKKALLQKYADGCDSDAVHLQAAALPRQKYQVILPVPSLKDTEIYAPNYKDGEVVALIRYPHGGTFEIPKLTVNNKQKDAKNMLGNALDAVGINSRVAERLSGADFDGDTVMVIPTRGNGRNLKVNITSTDPLEKLVGFDPKLEYGGKKPGTFKPMRNTQTEMGKISNLITDMTLKGAEPDELARAVKHSMVVIDAEKHKLDYKKSESDNNIAALKKKYQGTVDPGTGRYHEGAGTLISRAKSETPVLKRQGSPIINTKLKADGKPNPDYDPKRPEGALLWKTADDITYVDKKTGKTITRTQPSTKMAETDDARTLSTGHPTEEAYAVYANKMKSLANNARKELIATGNLKYNPEAKKEYAEEVASLNARLNVALKNAPRERKAQTMANAVVNAKRKEYPDLTKGEIKKIGQQALNDARVTVGAKRDPIKISDKEWEAIQKGAISEATLKRIIDNSDLDSLRAHATPRATTTLSSGKVNKIKAMSNSGYTTAEIAEALGVSSSTIYGYLKKGVK